MSYQDEQPSRARNSRKGSRAKGPTPRSNRGINHSNTADADYMNVYMDVDEGNDSVDGDAVLDSSFDAQDSQDSVDLSEQVEEQAKENHLSVDEHIKNSVESSEELASESGSSSVSADDVEEAQAVVNDTTKKATKKPVESPSVAAPQDKEEAPDTAEGSSGEDSKHDVIDYDFGDDSDAKKEKRGEKRMNKTVSVDDINTERNRVEPSFSRKRGIFAKVAKKNQAEAKSRGKSIRADQLSASRDTLLGRKVVSWAVVGSLLLFSGLGVKTLIDPPTGMTQNDVLNLLEQTPQYTKFPMEAGQGIATDFMRAYLNVNSDEASNQVRSYFYTGSLEGDPKDIGVGADSGPQVTPNRAGTGTFSQKVLYGPTVYKATPISKNSASYTIGAFVKSAEVTKGKDGKLVYKSNTAEAKQKENHWVFFNVNVFHNDATNSFSISQDSPSLVPSEDIVSQRNVPNPAPLGEQVSDSSINDSIRSTVNGFVQGYSKSTPEEHSAIDQYIVSNPDPSLTNGLGGLYKIAKSSGVQYETFTKDTKENSQLKVRVAVTWVQDASENSKASSSDSSSSDSSSSDSSSSSDDSDATTSTSKEKPQVTYTSRYVMTLDKTADNRYLVSKFAPELYIPDPDDMQQKNQQNK